MQYFVFNFFFRSNILWSIIKYINYGIHSTHVHDQYSESEKHLDSQSSKEN